MSVLPEILEWSRSRPKWQRDAIRRIIQGIVIDDEQIAELTELCLREYKVEAEEGDLQCVPLSEEHISGLSTTTETVVLRGIANLKHVNALIADRRLPFAENGITVIYGDNGSGKSGYGRVLKHVCRCRSRKPAIHANVYEPAPTSPSSATIEFSIDGIPQTYEWVATPSSTTYFGQVSFFDSDCASNYVETKANIAYRPFGLDVLPKLVEVCDRIRESLQVRIEALSVKMTFTGFTATTLAGKFISSLSGTPTHESFEAVCGKYVDTAPRIAQIRNLLAALDTNTVGAKVTDLQFKAKRFRDLEQTLDDLTCNLSGAKFAALRNAKADRDAKKAAVEASQTFQPQVLAGIGTQSWLVLWNAARQYSAEAAYPKSPFPVTDGNALCVLCQQPLGTAGAERLEKLEEFVKREVHVLADAAEVCFAACRDGFAMLNVPDPDTLDVIAEISQLDAVLAQEVRTFLGHAAAHQSTAMWNCVELEWKEPSDSISSPGNKLHEAASKLDLEAKQLETTLQPAVEAALRGELAELTEHELLLSLKSDILDELASAAQRQLLEIHYGGANTNTITSKNGEMIRRVLTNDLKGRLEDELKGLSLGYLSVDVADLGNHKGELYYQVELKGKKNSVAKATEVLSEGEHRCIALAAFLAEVSTQSSASTIVFDDPVTSLDHGRREIVAKRLVKEAANRPVVVMTHDVVFLLNLNEAAEANGTPFESSFLESRGAERGIPVDGLPWRGLTTAKRVKWLRSEIVELEKCYRDKPTGEYERQASFLWGRLRESWEAGVEEVLLAGTVVRFGRAVSTQKLRNVHDITQEDIDAVDRGMTISSSWLSGHTQSSEINAPMPEPCVLKQAVEDLETWRAAIVKRRP